MAITRDAEADTHFDPAACVEVGCGFDLNGKELTSFHGPFGIEVCHSGGIDLLQLF